MSTRLPLLILDEIMLPGTGTEVGLDPAELRFLEARAGGPGGALTLAIACRRPDARPPTAMEQKAAGSPGTLAEGALLGEGTLLPPSEADPVPRLALARTSRARLGDVRAAEGGWDGAVTPWPYDREGFDPAEVTGLQRRFYRALLASREPAPGLREQVERPVEEMEGADDPLVRLLLLADYLFERPDVRHEVLLAERAADVRDVVVDALDLLEEGLPGGSGPVREALRVYLGDASREGMMGMAATARVVRALAPLAEPDAALLAEIRAVTEAMEALQGRFERVAEKLVRRGRRRAQ